MPEPLTPHIAAVPGHRLVRIQEVAEGDGPMKPPEAWALLRGLARVAVALMEEVREIRKELA